MDREDSVPWRSLPRSARRVFAVIQAAIGERASVSYASFIFKHHIGKQCISPGIRMLDALGFIDIARGPNACNSFSLSERWRDIDEADVERLVAQARLPLEVRPQRPALPRPERSFSWGNARDYLAI